VERLKEKYGKLKILMENLGPFVGNEQDKVHEVSTPLTELSGKPPKRRSSLSGFAGPQYLKSIVLGRPLDDAETALRDVRQLLLTAAQAWWASAETQCRQRSARTLKGAGNGLRPKQL